MFALKRLMGVSLFVFVLGGSGWAQDRLPVGTVGEPVVPVSVAPLVTATAAGDRVRFVSPGTVVQLRLEVYNEGGQKLFDTELRGGNVLDWHLQDGGGVRLTEGSYACVLTIKSLSGHFSQRVGLVMVSEKGAAVPGVEAAQLSMAQQQAIGPVAGAAEGNAGFRVLAAIDREAVTAVTHDGEKGQVTSTTGALTFRTGDLFSGKDVERMRVTSEGNVGIGTDKPEATLDVAGTIRATGTLKAASGVEFADGSRLNSTDGKLFRTDAAGEPLATDVAGTGTQGRLAKWTDNAGTLGNSVVAEDPSGKLGVGTVNPNYEITLFGNDVGLQLISPVTGVTVNDGFRFGITSVNDAFLWNAEATDMFFGTTATERMRIKSSGNVGIGTPAPTAKLHVAGNVNFTGLRTEATSGTPNVIGGASSNVITLGVTGATVAGGRSHSVLDDSGTIGGGRDNVVGGDTGGTTSDHGATVSGGERNRAESAYSSVAGGDNNIAAREGSAVGGGGGNLAQGRYSAIAGGINNTTGSDGATVGGGQNNDASVANSTIGGGEDNIASHQHTTVSGGQRNTASGQLATVPGGVDNTAQGVFSFAAGQRARAIHQGSFVWSDSTTVSPNFFSSTFPDQFLINATGGVGIGTNVPVARLHVRGASSTATTPIAVLESSGDQIPLSFRIGSTEFARIRTNDLGNLVFATINGTDQDIFFRAGGDSGADMFIDSATGNVGIGTTSPDARLDINGAIRLAAPTAGSGAALCRNGTSGLIVDCSGSSARYKQNILGLQAGLGVVGRLRPVSFNWKEDGQRDIGLVAEEVNRVEPLLVTRNAAGEVKGVRYDRLGVVLLNAVQEQQAQLKLQAQQLRAKDERIARLETRLARYDARLNSLEQSLRGRKALHSRRRNRR